MPHPAVVVPAAIAAGLVEQAHVRQEWETFSRQKLSENGHLRRYYPLSGDARPEYEA